MSDTTKGKILKAIGVVFCVLPPLAATLAQFPVFINRSSEATVSATFLLMAGMSMLPFLKQIKEWLKSPSVWILWCVFLVLFVALRNIIDEMIIICFVGVLSNICGAGIYNIGKNKAGKEKEDNNK